MAATMFAPVIITDEQADAVTDAIADLAESCGVHPAFRDALVHMMTDTGWRNAGVAIAYPADVEAPDWAPSLAELGLDY